MRLSEHFSLAEFVLSQTAARAGIDNTPDEWVLGHLHLLADRLELVRAHLRVPILISSGYRCHALNRLIGGSSTSAHVSGLAADFTAPAFGTPVQVAAAIAEVEEIQFDQIIHEYRSWVHFGLTAPTLVPRRELLTIFAGTAGYQAGLLP